MRYFGLPWSRDPRERIVRRGISHSIGGNVYAIPGAGARVRSEWAALTPRVPRGRISTPVLTRAAESGTRPTLLARPCPISRCGAPLYTHRYRRGPAGADSLLRERSSSRRGPYRQFRIAVRARVAMEKEPNPCRTLYLPEIATTGGPVVRRGVSREESDRTRPSVLRDALFASSWRLRYASPD